MSSNQDKCNLLNKTFANFFTKDSTPQTFLPHLNSTSPCSEDLLCSEDTVIDLISSLPLNTSPGPDGIPSILIKATAHSISVPLAHIFNLSISTGVFPSAFKNSTIIPIPKTSPPSSSPSAYHPISLLNLISKLLEKHLFNILLNHLYSTNFFSDSQYGFLPFRSTSSALRSATDYILSSLDKGVPQCGVFLDIRKAFDSVNHSLLITKILSLNLPLNITHCLNSYLNNRSQSVKVVDSISFPVPVESGVPQGSILGPLLFIIFVNDLASLPLPTNSKLIMYADDIFLLHPLSSTQDLASIQLSLIQLSLNLISNWLSINHLQVNPTKSKFIYFSFKHQSSFDSLPSLKLGNTPISRVYSYKYLGLIFTCTLSWLVHINQAISKAKRLLGLIYRQFYHYSSSSTLLSLYITIVRPILEYGSTIWDPLSTALSTSVGKVQFFALKIISKTWSTSYSNLLSSVNISSLEHRRRSAKLLLFFKLSNSLHFISSFPCHRSCKPEYALRHYSIFDFSRLFCRTLE